jgi:demethylmenaquinone methyltransferase/2-methoxy-6-polyprenyl-1,4-benzoquinol methylase
MRQGERGKPAATNGMLSHLGRVSALAADERGGSLFMINPYQESSMTHKEQIRSMFSGIAGRYDRMNHIFSLGIDRFWRKKAIDLLKPEHPSTILDIAAGTAGFSLAAARLNPASIIGIDISEEMLAVGRDYIARRGLEELIELREGDAESLPFDSERFDAVIVAFGVRNIGDRAKALSEMYRVLKSGGTTVILEFSQIRPFPFGALFRLYFYVIMPLLAGLISKNRRAYLYLPRSVESFPDRQVFLSEIRSAGFSDARLKTLTCGIVTVYSAKKA